ncbi:hypothetical protein MTO96_042297 [Rhipicephalus appendiculatus]
MAAGEQDKNAAEYSTTEGGDTSPVAEEGMIAHATDNENATEVLAAKEDQDASDEPRATLLVRSNYNDDPIIGVAEEDRTIAARASGRTEKVACTTTRTTAEANAENEPVYNQWVSGLAVTTRKGNLEALLGKHGKQNTQDSVDGKEGNIASEADDGDEGKV